MYIYIYIETSVCSGTQTANQYIIILTNTKQASVYTAGLSPLSCRRAFSHRYRAPLTLRLTTSVLRAGASDTLQP